ncbi:MAG TPA: hydratase [Aestuariivirgaceae bacterium]|nr:hydratase [Aestuariivirgaceae bacterium]
MGQAGQTEPLADVEAIASEVLAASAEARQIAPFSSNYPGFDLDAAYRVAAAVRHRRMARGETPVGRKIGFTNRMIWAEYGVDAPIWGYMYDTTVRDIASGDSFSLDGLQEPRIEPEIAFGLGRAPEPGMDEIQLLSCIDWVAHGFEIVQSIFPDWRFAAADTVAAFGMHGAFLCGERRTVRPEETSRWLAELAAFSVMLQCDGGPAISGHAGDVLGGPVTALGHLVDLLARDPANPPLSAGEIITTGTVTRAMPIAPGETWRTTLEGVGLDGLAVRFV